MSFSRVRRALTACVTGLLAATAACVGSTDATAPAPGSPATTRVALAARVGPIAQVEGTSTTLQVAIAYLRAAGDSVPVGVQSFALGSTSTQQLPITIDLATCLNDPARRGAPLGTGSNAVCVVRLDFTLVQGTTVLDRQAVLPITVRPGQITTVDGPITLYTVATVRIAGPGSTPAGAPVRVVLGQPVPLAANAADAAGQPVTSRTPVWTSADTTVATVDTATGLVTGRAPGRTTITAVVGGRSASVSVAVVGAPSTITVAVAGGLGNGSVTSVPAGIACQVAAGVASGTCSASFAADTLVTLAATPATGSSFASWAGDCASAGAVLTCQLSPAAPRTASVTFVAFRTLSVTMAGTGDGAVSSQPDGIRCQLVAAPPDGNGPGTTSGTCSAPYLDGGRVTLTAAPGATSSFAGWTGACATASLSCTVTLEQAQSVTATFVRRQATLTLTVGGSGAGTLTTTGAGVVGPGTCVLTAGAGSTTCSVPVSIGATVTITAEAGSASSFAGWAGACASTTGPSCVLRVNADVSAGAVFTLLPVPLSVVATSGNTGAGTITSSDNAIECAIGGETLSGACQVSTPVGTVVTLRATAAEGQVFLGWGGACAASGRALTCALTITTSTRVSAAFGPPQTFSLTLAGTDGAGGTVTGAGTPCVLAGSEAGVTCTTAVSYGSVVTATATPDSASAFVGWGGDCASAGSSRSCSVTVDQTRAATASFRRRTATVTLALSGPAGGTVGGRVTVDGVTVCTLPGGGGSTSCTLTVPLYSTASYTAVPGPNALFGGWTGACSGTGPCSLTVTGNVSIGAAFAPATAALTVRAPAAPNVSTGGGQVTSTPAGIACTYTRNSGTAGSCASTVVIGTAVTLTASPDADSFLAAWEAPGTYCAGTLTLACSFTARTNGVAVARFSQAATFELDAGNADVFGVTFGSVLVQTAGREDAIYPAMQQNAVNPRWGFGRTVTLTARPTDPNIFVGWSGDCAFAGRNPVCTLVNYSAVPGQGGAVQARVIANFNEGLILQEARRP